MLARLIHIALETIKTKVFLQRHAMLDGKHLIVIVIDAMVEDSLDNQVFTGLCVEKQGVELFENVLHRQGHVTVAASKVEIILLVGNQFALDGSTNTFVEKLVFVTLDDNAFH